MLDHIKKYILLIIAALSIAPLSAYNLQKVYPIDTNLFRQIRTLLISSGYSEPSTSGPWSAAELKSMVKALDTGTLNQHQKDLYLEILKQLEQGNPTLHSSTLSASFEPILTTEAYIHTNTASDMNDILSPFGYADQKALISIPLEVWLDESVYGTFDLDFRKVAFKTKDFTYETVESNIFFSTSNMENNYPMHALMAWGNNNSQLIFGRDRLSWGSGETGNFLVGSSADYYDFMQYTIFGSAFRYTYLMTQFNTINGETGSVGYTVFGKDYQVYIAHRYEIQPTSFLQFSITESSFFAVDGLDIRMFAPVMFLHNYNNFKIGQNGQGNNILAFELSITPKETYNVYMQCVIDQIQFANELTNGMIEDDTLPPAYGVMLGLRKEQVLPQATLSIFLEGVYTSPYLYLNTRYITDANDPDRFSYSDYDFIVGNSSSSQSFGRFLGYKYGPDAIIAAFGIKYADFARKSAYANVIWMAHGENRLLANEMVPELETGEAAFFAVSPTGKTELGLRIELGFTFQLAPGLSLYSTNSFTAYWNYINGKILPGTSPYYPLSGTNWQDIRSTIGVSITPTQWLPPGV